MPDPIQGHNQISVEVASAHNRATYLNPDYFCALSVGWICAYISVWWHLETTTNSTVVLWPLCCSNSLGFLSDCISYFPQFCHTSIISLIGFSCTHPPLAAFAKPHAARIPHRSICSFYHHLNIIVVIYPRQVQPGDHNAPYIAFSLLHVAWPITCQNLGPCPESNG